MQTFRRWAASSSQNRFRKSNAGDRVDVWLSGGGLDGWSRWLRHRTSASAEINHCLETRELITDYASSPGPRVLASRIVTNAHRVDTQRPTGGNCPRQEIGRASCRERVEVEGRA